MAAPKHEIIQTTYQNPHAEDGLELNLVVVSNTPEEKLIENIRENSRKYENWLQMQDPHDGVAVLIAGGWSANNHVDDIKALADKGAKIIVMNGSADWARKNGIQADWQVIVDAKVETSALVDPSLESYFASQCDPSTLKRAEKVTLVHFGLETIEEFLPEDRVKRGGYALLGAGTTVGYAAISVAFSQGYRELHLFGYDSSYNDGRSHAYDQSMNRFMPTVDVEWGGKSYQVSVAMKGQAEKFPLNAFALKQAGCDLHVYGEGLLQAIHNTKYEDMGEREKYQLMWNIPAYRTVAPGERLVDVFLEVVQPDDAIIDIGCGTGRASVKLAEAGHKVILVDFTDNCRDQEALGLPFIRADISKKIPVHVEYGFCTDVMEHIPTDDVDATLKNIFLSADNVFFQISTVDDGFGVVIGQVLHNTVKPHDWWKAKMKEYGRVVFEKDNKVSSLFYVKKGD